MNSNEEAPDNSIFYRTLDSAFLPVNKYLIYQIGLSAAAFLAYIPCNPFTEDWVCCTRIEIYHETGLSDTQQRSIIKKLKKLKLIETERRGIPAKTWYKINYERLAEIIESAPKSTGGVK